MLTDHVGLNIHFGEVFMPNLRYAYFPSLPISQGLLQIYTVLIVFHDYFMFVQDQYELQQSCFIERKIVITNHIPILIIIFYMYI
jgi:hypothetical protein